MTSYKELFAIADRMNIVRNSTELESAEGALQVLNDVATDAGRAFSGSWLGYHAYVYYADLAAPPPGAHFSQEWGIQDLSFTSLGSAGDWREHDPKKLDTFLRARAGNVDLTAVASAASAANETFNVAKAEIRSILLLENADGSDVFLGQLLADLDEVQPPSTAGIAEIWSPKGQMMTRDTIVLGQGTSG